MIQQAIGQGERQGVVNTRASGSSEPHDTDREILITIAVSLSPDLHARSVRITRGRQSVLPFEAKDGAR